MRFTVAILFLAILAACSLVPPPSPTPSPLEVRGRGVFESFCSRCHSTIPDSIIVGPSLAGIATRGAGRVEGMDAQAYIRNSIFDPAAYTVEGFVEGTMPATLKDELSVEQLDAVMAYLLTLK